MLYVIQIPDVATFDLGADRLHSMTTDLPGKLKLKQAICRKNVNGNAVQVKGFINEAHFLPHAGLALHVWLPESSPVLPSGHEGLTPLTSHDRSSNQTQYYAHPNNKYR